MHVRLSSVKRVAGALCVISATSVTAVAQTGLPREPTGDWRVAKGVATIRIVNCDEQYWGVVVWEQTPGTDSKNPDPNLRSRPTLGMPVLLGMTPTKPNEWSGDIYNAQDGRTYSASISLLQPDLLKVQGCVLGFLCGGENWTRVLSETATDTTPRPGAGKKAQSPDTARPSPSGKPAVRSSAPKPSTQPIEAQSAEEICSGLVGLAGSTHERRLK